MQPMPMTCPTCGNASLFLVKTAQVHVVALKHGRVEIAEESLPAVFELLCDQCETALDLDRVDSATRGELLLAIGAQ